MHPRMSSSSVKIFFKGLHGVFNVDTAANDYAARLLFIAYKVQKRGGFFVFGGQNL
jgi:hypothetical protein